MSARPDASASHTLSVNVGSGVSGNPRLLPRLAPLPEGCSMSYRTGVGCRSHGLEACRRTQLIRLGMLPSRDAQRFLKGALGIFQLAEAEQGDAFEAMKLCEPLVMAGLLLSPQPLLCRSEGRPVLTPPRQRFGQPG